MEQGSAERRRGRRITLEAPLLIRRVNTATPEPFRTLVTTNISLVGLYFETDIPDAFSVNDTVVASVSIPEPQRREFPFARVAGPSRVVRVMRVDQPPPPEGSRRTSVGVALEFSDDITILTASPSR